MRTRLLLDFAEARFNRSHSRAEIGEQCVVLDRLCERASELGEFMCNRDNLAF
jgi:hypothetical protein